MARNQRDTPPLKDGEYWATCKERSPMAAILNGHGAVFPQSRMTVRDGWAYFMRDGKEVWRCNARYAAFNFTIQDA
ncbi:hypothetical protein LA345_39285 (plasmid) [Burkholderia vietnamiensis]|uniref:Uncharacterized protein n=1 Tax=Burkholderia vietnamiensis (strain G4 / LMG 22486) TaxID=269482 RepID=A4JWA0_BURVG|nr:conserved hypothetical protein [Burkholderia vietnamiensis G4]MCB4349845.1 hypothetical protein [Burkholderia vietnamiensis]